MINQPCASDSRLPANAGIHVQIPDAFYRGMAQIPA